MKEFKFRKLVENILKYHDKLIFLRPYNERMSFYIDKYQLPKSITFEMLVFFRCFYNPDIDELAPFSAEQFAL